VRPDHDQNRVVTAQSPHLPASRPPSLPPRFPSGGRYRQHGSKPTTSCHIQHQYEGLANTLSQLAKGATSRRKKLQIKIDRAGQAGPDDELVIEFELARQTEARACRLARDVRTLTQWLSRDVLAVAGPVLATRQMLFDFIEMNGAFARCASRCRTNATICSPSPVFLTTN
jgi:hypothetical protein